MAWFRKSENPGKTAAAPPSGGTAESRRVPRYSTAVVSCMLGQVADLSSCGMRVTSNTQPPVGVGDLVRLELQSPKDELVVVGRVARMQKRKPMGFEIGIEFQQLTPELSAALDSLARHGCVKGVPGVGGVGGRGPADGAGRVRGGGGVTVSTNLPDLYAMLGVAPGAPNDDIHRAFRELARQCHPDLNPSPEAQTKFIELHKAYDVLKCSEKRRSYDVAWAGNAARAAA